MFTSFLLTNRKPKKRLRALSESSSTEEVEENIQNSKFASPPPVQTLLSNANPQLNQRSVTPPLQRQNAMRESGPRDMDSLYHLLTVISNGRFQ